jgi:hypothetical protein
VLHRGAAAAGIAAIAVTLVRPSGGDHCIDAINLMLLAVPSSLNYLHYRGTSLKCFIQYAFQLLHGAQSADNVIPHTCLTLSIC